MWINQVSPALSMKAALLWFGMTEKSLENGGRCAGWWPWIIESAGEPKSGTWFCRFLLRLRRGGKVLTPPRKHRLSQMLGTPVPHLPGRHSSQRLLHRSARRLGQQRPERRQPFVGDPHVTLIPLAGVTHVTVL